MEQYKCSRCQVFFEKSEVFVSGKCKGKKGIALYYNCRKCNTEKCKIYRETENGRKKIYIAVYSSIKRNQYKQNARARLLAAVKKGKIKKPNRCKCGNSKPEAHHPDYSRPLDVEWLCRICHARLHHSSNMVGHLLWKNPF